MKIIDTGIPLYSGIPSGSQGNSQPLPANTAENDPPISSRTVVHQPEAQNSRTRWEAFFDALRIFTPDLESDWNTPPGTPISLRNR